MEAERQVGSVGALDSRETVWEKFIAYKEKIHRFCGVKEQFSTLGYQNITHMQVVSQVFEVCWQ